MAGEGESLGVFLWGIYFVQGEGSLVTVLPDCHDLSCFPLLCLSSMMFCITSGPEKGSQPSMD